MKNLIALVIVIVVAVGCGKALESHSSTGVVKEIRDPGKVMVIEHKEFPGFMDAMTMPFTLKDPSVGKDIKPGDTVSFTLEKGGKWFVVSKMEKSK